MLYRLVVILMMALFPLQWSVAQVHELADDTSILSVASDGPAQVAALLAHTDEPGGVCQFHQLSQVFVDIAAPSPPNLSAHIDESWKLRSHATFPRSHFLSEIDKPKWNIAPPPAAVS